MKKQIDKFDNLVDIIFYILMIICMVILIWTIKTAKPIIIYMDPKSEDVDQKSITKNIDQTSGLDITLNELPIPKIKPRYGFTEDEIYLMAVLLSGSKYIDGDGEYDIDFESKYSQEQINLVLNVIMNRVNSDKFPHTVSEVIWAPGQFSPMKKWVNGLPKVSDISLQKVREWCKNYDTYNPDCQTIPDNHLYFYGNGVINKSRERWYN